jgi:hypothetical protein
MVPLTSRVWAASHKFVQVASRRRTESVTSGVRLRLLVPANSVLTPFGNRLATMLLSFHLASPTAKHTPMSPDPPLGP